MSNPALYDEAARLNNPDEPDIPRCAACRAALLPDDLRDRRQVCTRCEHQVLAALDDVAELWCLLPEHLLKPQLPGTGTGGTAPEGSAAPGNLTVLSLLAGEAAARLAVWDAAWREKLGWRDTPLRGRPDHALRQILRFLRDHLPWAVREAGDLVASLRADVRRLVGYMRTATADTRSLVPLPQPCPYATTDTPDAPPCEGKLLMDRERREIRCVRCSATVPMHSWRELGIAVGALQPNAA
ncbi:hypothetical protein [Kitasatospora sp. NPDC004272]